MCAVLLSLLLVSARSSAASRDPLFDHLWGLQQIRAPQAWEVTRGAGTTVAVVDSGIDRSHPDLTPNLGHGVTLSGCADMDDLYRDRGCGDGDYQAETSGTPWHGTHVAGTIAAAADNGIGVAGVAPEATLLPVQVCAPNCNSIRAGRGVRWAADHGADVINLSLGGLTGTQVLDEAGYEILGFLEESVRYAVRKGAVVIAASGNSYRFPLCNSPAYVPGVVCVAATNSDEQIATYSNQPIKPDLLTVAAPGGDYADSSTGQDLWSGLGCNSGVVSTVPAGIGRCGYSEDAAYRAAAGSSMAAPHVSGVAALLRSVGCTAPQTVDLLTATARQPVTDQRGVWTPAYGFGIVDAHAAVAAAQHECEPLPSEDEEQRERPACLREREVLMYPGLPEGWTVDSPVNDDGTPTWEYVFDPVVTGGEMRTVAAGPSAKDDRLVSTPFEVTEHSELAVAHRWILGERDGAVLEISIDDGANWQDIGADRFVDQGYNGTMADGRPAWTSTIPGAHPGQAPRAAYAVTISTVDLGDFAGQTVRLRWRLLQHADQADAPGAAWWLRGLRVTGSPDETCHAGTP